MTNERHPRRIEPTHPASYRRFLKSELDQSVPARFETIVASYPDRLAVKTESATWTYDELNRLANHLAHAILQKRGAIPESVGLLVEDESYSVAAILGVLKSGKTYVPLDASFPPARLSAVLSEAEIQFLIAEKRNFSSVQRLAGPDRIVICVDDLDASLPEDDTGLTISPDSVAALIYTSGSTGRPKGVIQDHRNLLHRTMVVTNSFGIAPEDRISLVSAPTYSASLRPLFSALLNGASIYAFNILKYGAGELGDWLSREGVTIYFSVPSVFRRWVGNLTGSEDFSRLRIIDLAGESVTNLDVDMYKRHFSAPTYLVNTLGTNEAGIMRMYFMDRTTEITESIAPVGYEVEDKEILILDDEGRELGTNQVGEIAVRSAFLSPGYWKQPELTALTFRNDPAKPHHRIYRTGDLGCLLPDGCLLYKGRNQFRPKIRGIRIELEEVEGGLHAHPLIQEAVIAIREDKDSGEQQLIAYVVPLKDAALTVPDIRKFLTERLPAQMLPASVVFLTALPRTVHGKVDRGALPEIHEARSSDEIVVPRDAVERKLATMWQAILGVSTVSVEASFFDLGGDSLTAVHLIAAVKKVFGKKIPTASIFQSPTIRQFAAILRREKVAEEWSSLVPVQPIGSKPPFFWIHGDSSSVFLSRHLGVDQPLYLLTHQSEDGEPAKYTAVETIAEYYLQEIRTIQKTGPWVLGGYSFGATVAFEIAQKLRRQQETVDLLVLLDPPPLNPQATPARAANSSIRQRMRTIAVLTTKERIERLILRLRESCNTRISQIQKSLKRRICKIYVMLGAQIPVTLRSVYILDVYRRARQRYLPRPYDGPVLLFKGTTRSYDSELDWEDVLTGEVEIHEVSADHTKLRDQPHVHTWAEKLKTALLKAQSGSSRAAKI